MPSHFSQHVHNAAQSIFVRCGSSHKRWSAVFRFWNVVILCFSIITALHWRHNDHAGVSNHQPHGCLLNRLFRRRSKKTPKLRVTGLCVGNSPGPVNSSHKGPVKRKMFPFDDVIMVRFESLWFPPHQRQRRTYLFKRLTSPGRRWIIGIIPIYYFWAEAKRMSMDY